MPATPVRSFKIASPLFISHVRELYLQVLVRCCIQHRQIAVYTNDYVEEALVAYILAVTAIEAFVNEVCMGPMVKAWFPSSELWELQGQFSDWVERMRLVDKLVLFPRLLFGATFDMDQQPYQDVKKLVALRNSVVHYKMDKGPSYLKDLIQTKECFSFGEQPADYEPPWTEAVCTIGGIRWAHDTVCKTAQKLASFPPEENQRKWTALPLKSFELLTDTVVRRELEARLSESSWPT